MATPLPLTTQVVDALGDHTSTLYQHFLTDDGRIDAQEAAILEQVNRLQGTAALADLGRRLALMLMNTGDITPWGKRQIRELALEVAQLANDAHELETHEEPVALGAGVAGAAE